MAEYKCEKCADHVEFIPKEIVLKNEKCAICGKKMKQIK